MALRPSPKVPREPVGCSGVRLATTAPPVPGQHRIGHFNFLVTFWFWVQFELPGSSICSHCNCNCNRHCNYDIMLECNFAKYQY